MYYKLVVVCALFYCLTIKLSIVLDRDLTCVTHKHVCIEYFFLIALIVISLKMIERYLQLVSSKLTFHGFHTVLQIK